MSVQPMLYSTLTYRNGVSIVSLFISTGRLAMPDFDEWSRQWAHAFLVVLMLIRVDHLQFLIRIWILKLVRYSVLCFVFCSSFNTKIRLKVLAASDMRVSF